MIESIELFKSVVAENRMIQKEWHTSIDGKEYVCLAAAWGKPGTINSVKDCPSELFPQWVFELMPTFDDGVSATEVSWLFKGFAERAEKMAAFSDARWKTVRTSFLIGVIDIAVDHAQRAQPSPAPAYWQQVIDATSQVKTALKTNDKEAARAARAAAGAAGWAIAAEAAAIAAARVARVAEAAIAAEAAARAARAAGAAAYKEIASMFFTCVDSMEESK